MEEEGLIQPIGGANEKIEGFWKVCKGQGFTGTQGVIIPKSNEKELMLDDALVEDVKAGNFHVYAVSTIDEAVEIVMDMPAKKIDKKIKKKLAKFCKKE